MSDEEYGDLHSPEGGYGGSQQPKTLYADKGTPAPKQPPSRQAVQAKKTNAPRILVHPESRLTAAQLVAMIRRSKTFPEFLKRDLHRKGNFLTMPDRFTRPRGIVAGFLDPFHSAFLDDSWQISTAGSTIVVTKASGGDLTFEQVVTPDLSKNERLGRLAKTGTNQKTFMVDDPLRSDEKEIIRGWTVPHGSTQELNAKRGLVLIVTRTAVTNQDGKVRVFTPTEDVNLEAMLHEVAVHAGRIVLGLDDKHGNPTVDGLGYEIAQFFYSSTPGGDICPSSTATEIWKYLKLRTGPPEGCP